MSDSIDFKFATEVREGVEHFKSGQHHAFRAEEDTSMAVLVYVDAMGWAVAMPCAMDPETEVWRHAGLAVRTSATGISTGWREVKPSFELSHDMVRALFDAEVVPEDDVVAETQKGRTIFEEKRGR